MAKPKVIGVYKSEKHNCYIFAKRQEFFALARGLLKKVGFQHEYEWNTLGRPVDKKCGDIIFKEEENIEEYIDRREVFEREGYFIEIVFGKDKVFLMIHTEEDKQEELSSFLSKFFRW